MMVMVGESGDYSSIIGPGMSEPCRQVGQCQGQVSGLSRGRGLNAQKLKKIELVAIR